MISERQLLSFTRAIATETTSDPKKTKPQRPLRNAEKSSDRGFSLRLSAPSAVRWRVTLIRSMKFHFREAIVELDSGPVISNGLRSKNQNRRGR
jgi:hypothetical protein